MFHKGPAPSKLTSCEDDFVPWFEHLEENFSYAEVLFKKLCLSVKASRPPAVNITETPELN